MSVMLAYHSELPFARGAFLGLSQFFTLSGFLITGLLLQAYQSGGIGLRDFWARRFRRLMPAALLCLVGVVVFGATVATQQQAEELPGGVAASATYVANWFFVVTDKSYVDLFADPSPVQHYWSLAVEEQFYLVLPILLLGLFGLTRSQRVLAACFAGAAVASTLWMIFLYRSGAGLDRLYYGTDTRMAEILVGGLMAIVLFNLPRISGRALGVCGAVGVVAYALTAWGSTTLPLADGPIWQGGFLLFSVVSCAVILGVLSERGPLAPALSWGPLPAMGRITYGLYLYHWPIFLWLSADRTGLDPWPLFALRLLVTFAAAIASYHLVEMPIRAGSGWARRSIPWVVAGPAVGAVVVLGAFLFANTSAPDPLATIRSDERSLVAPVTPTDGRLDILLVTDVAGEEVADRMVELAADDEAVDVVRAEPLSCSELVGEPGERICGNWPEEWGKLVTDHNPDIVVLYLDRPPASMLADVEGDPIDFIQEVMGSGVDVLTGRGAPVMWAQSGASFEVGVARSLDPFIQAMLNLEQDRPDVEKVLGTRLLDPELVSRTEYVDNTAKALIADASLYQRADRDRLPKVMVIGDSQARSLGYGLERWGAEEDVALVWNAASEGCGLADEGFTRGFGDASPISERCLHAVAQLPEKVESFDPDMVIVLTSIWDIQDRSHPSWDGFLTVGDDAMDRYLRSEFEEVVDVVTAHGASVVWMNAPCTNFVPVQGRPADLPASFDPERSRLLNSTILEPMAEERDEISALFDLDAVLCPDGSYVSDLDGVSEVRVDGIHFSVDGALWFADNYGAELLELGL